ncbi:glucose homeostasis, partial [Musa troglodytarum]
MHLGLASQGGSTLKIRISYVDNLPPDVVTELTRAIEKQGLDMQVSALDSSRVSHAPPYLKAQSS